MVDLYLFGRDRDRASLVARFLLGRPVCGYNAEMYSTRFQRTIVITHHAKMRMDARGVNELLLLDIIDSGETRYRDATHLWVFKSFSDRSDNLLCAVLVLEDRLVVKTVMHHFEVI